MLPDVKLYEQEHGDIGVWGNRRRQYLKQNHQIKYYNMLMQCTLYPHLANIEQQAQEMFLLLVEEVAEKEGVTEKLKAENPILWVQRMNNIQNRAMDIVYAELIYA